ncbi:MAG: BamA/TamA family outer membrane protein, partial [Pseudomonadota bacterium]
LVLRVKINIGIRWQFSFSGNTAFTRQEVSLWLRNVLRGQNIQDKLEEIKTVIIEKYKEKGIYGVIINGRMLSGKTADGVSFKTYYLDIKEGEKVRVEDVVFRGQEYFTSNQLRELYLKNATTLAFRKYLDVKYLETFVDILKREYLTNGFLLPDIPTPRTIWGDGNKSALIEYQIREKTRTIISAVDFSGVDQLVAQELREKMKNQVGQPLDAISIQGDLNLIVRWLQNKGYYWSEIINDDDNSFLSYSVDHREVKIKLEIKTGPKIAYDGLIVKGNLKTRFEVIGREVDFSTGELVTAERLEEIKTRLLSLGLFSQINIAPLELENHDNLSVTPADIVIQVKEKEFGMVEVAPGYRTDIGVKLSTAVTYNNLFGMNRTLGLRTQINQRLDFQNLDERRRIEEKRMLEYQIRSDITEPYLFNYPVTFVTDLSFTRKRFFSFDAKISKASFQLSKDFTKIFSSSLQYQIEAIEQYDATDLKKDRGYFRIGSITPGITFDFRNNKINPRDGAYFSLSSEWATPKFGSLKKEDSEINYVKYISRNRFYKSFGDLILALSLSGGYQRNMSHSQVRDTDGSLVSKGYIPSIKVFRLEGIDTVRGFDDSEINRLDIAGKPDINQVVVDNLAYFVNLKFEPRYLIDDNMALGPFFDAGRVYVNKFKPLSLRTAAGISFKFLTPVGSLDFDYGFKMKRETLPGDRREAFGRFNLSIGHF